MCINRHSLGEKKESSEKKEKRNIPLSAQPIEQPQKEVKNMNPDLCEQRIYLTDTCGLTHNTCYRNRNEMPNNCPLNNEVNKQ